MTIGSPLKLSEQTLSKLDATIGLRYSREATRIGVAHLGPGAFFRAHQAAYFDALLEQDPRWAISAIALRSSGVRDALAPQQGLYTLSELSSVSRVRVIGAVRELLVAAEDPHAVFSRLTDPQTHLVTLTVTEKGYCLDAHDELDLGHPDIVHDLSHCDAPRSAIGWLVAALKRRRERGVSPFTVISCDNLSDNGNKLRSAMLGFAVHIDPHLAKWIGAEVPCPRTMVDSITPATDDALRDRIATQLGLQDAWPIQRESFTQWVIEDVPSLRDIDLQSVGVTLTSDVSNYERAKLYLLNGAHSTLAYVGILRGHVTVLEAMNDAALAQFVEGLMREDIALNLTPTPGFDIPAYIGEVLERFRNPGLRHFLSQITWDGSKKLPVRLLATVADTLRAGRPVNRLAVPIAAWMRFIVGCAKSGQPFVDPEKERLHAIGAGCTFDPAQDVKRFLALRSVFPATLAESEAFGVAVQAAYARLGAGQL